MKTPMNPSQRNRRQFQHHSRLAASALALVATGLVLSVMPPAVAQSSDQNVKQRIAALEAKVSEQSAQIAALQNLLVHFSRSGNEVFITGGNLHIDNGMGQTDSINGLGNLIVGYNEPPRDEGGASDRTERGGSHNLVVGSEHNFSGYGGLLSGFHNSLLVNFGALLGGCFNSAVGKCATVSGGTNNAANGDSSSVSGGHGNGANGDSSSVSGGASNIAFGASSSVSGGDGNHAIGNFSSVSGGDSNTASGDFSSVSGGESNAAYGAWSSVSGGLTRSVLGSENWAAGGLFQDF
jgi:hypothetical protein